MLYIQMLPLLICSTYPKMKHGVIKRAGRLEVKESWDACVTFEFYRLHRFSSLGLLPQSSRLLFVILHPLSTETHLNLASTGACNNMVFNPFFFPFHFFSLTLPPTLLYFRACKRCPSLRRRSVFPAASFHNPLSLSPRSVFELASGLCGL